MNTSSRWRWSALAVTLGIAVPAARAEMITPDSISNPPSAVSSTNGTLVYSSNSVTNQYASLGLKLSGAAITQLNGVSVWVPLGIAVGGPGAPLPTGAIDYAWGLSGSLVSPGSSNPTTVSSLTVDLFGLTGTPSLEVYGLNGQLLNIVPVPQPTPGLLPGSQVWTFTGSGISSFSVAASNSQAGAWGVPGVSFTPTTATAPEPSSLVLAGLGALGLAARWRCRRFRAIA